MDLYPGGPEGVASVSLFLDKLQQEDAGNAIPQDEPVEAVLRDEVEPPHAGRNPIDVNGQGNDAPPANAAGGRIGLPQEFSCAEKCGGRLM